MRQIAHQVSALILLVGLVMSQVTPLANARQISKKAARQGVQTSPSKSSPGGNNRALLIGVSEYKTSEILPELHTELDIAGMSNILENNYAFQPSDIVTLNSPQTTTRANILAQLNKLANDTQAGDTVVIFYSGHGSQSVDDNGDEADGLDEMIEPYDVEAALDEDGRPAIDDNGNWILKNEIRDDELNRVLANILNKNPKSVTMIFDSCNSGSVTRQKFVSNAKKPFITVRPAKNSPSKGTSRMMVPSVPGLLDNLNADNSNLIVISAAASNELAMEYTLENGDTMGALTYALTKTIQGSKEGITAQTVLNRLNSELAVINPDQHAQVEGDLDTVLFSDKRVKSMPYTQVAEIITEVSDSITPGVAVKLPIGLLHNATEGSQFALYDESVTVPDASKPIVAEGVIEAARLDEAVLRIEKVNNANLTPDILKSLHAFQTSQTIDSKEMMLVLDKVPTPVAQQIKTKVNSDMFKVVSATPQLSFASNVLPFRLIGQTNGQGVLYDHAGTALKAFDLRRNSVVTDLQDYLERQRIAKGLQMVEIPKFDEERVETRVRLVAAKVGSSRNAFGEVTYDSDKPTPFMSNFSDISSNVMKDDYYTIEVANVGERPAYVYIMNFDNEHGVHLLYPAVLGQTNDNLVTNGGTNDNPNYKKINIPGTSTPLLYKATEPQESFRVIATTEPIKSLDYLNKLTKQKKGTHRDVSHNFTGLLDQILFKGSTAGVRSEIVPHKLGGPVFSRTTALTFPVTTAK